MRAPVLPPSSRSRSHKQTPSDHHQRWQFSEVSSASARSSSSSTSSVGRSLAAAARKAFGSCFAPRGDVDFSSSHDDFKSSHPPSSIPPSSPARSHTSKSSKSASRRSMATSTTTNNTRIGHLTLSMAEITKATKNFSPALKIGQGGFGTVYKGTLDDGTVVAIKRAKKSLYDNQLGVEFQNEIKTLSRVEHLNLVRFLGYVECQDERIVVVDYVPNGTLREHLDGLHRSQLDLATRLDIAIDVAHAVTYLHMYTDHPIIHRDIKSSNILLTENLRAKVADFGFARLGSNEAGISHVSTQVKGTAGYLDPEYLRTYQLTEKSDVYSFGVLLVELISGRRPIEPRRELRERITPKWAMKKFVEGNAIQVLDPSLARSPASNLALEKVLELALQCLAPTKQGRPSMRRCGEILWSIRKDYRELLLSSDSQSKHSLQD